MNKKLLCVGITVLSISSASFASGTMYTTPVPVAVPTGCDTTSDSYFYLGLQGGVADSGWKAIDKQVIGIVPLLPPSVATTTMLVSDTIGIAGRVFLGYSFNKYFAAELGYLYLGKKTQMNADITITDLNGKVLTSRIVDFGTVRTQAADLVGKVKGPITDNLGIYAKLGAGYLMMKGSNDFYKSDKIDLVYGAGISYDFNENWAMDLSWTRYNSGDTKIVSREWQPNVDFYALGVTFKFAGF